MDGALRAMPRSSWKGAAISHNIYGYRLENGRYRSFSEKQLARSINQD
jgi:hypothetical protein